MRKIIVSLLLGALLVAALAVPAAAAATPITVEAAKIEKAPVIDGVITEEEWGKPFFSDAPQDHEHFCGVKDTAVHSVYPKNIDLYSRWDDKYFYVGAVVTENKHHNTQKDAGIWNGDAIELDIVAEGKPQGVRFRTTMGVNSKTGEAYGYFFHIPNAALDGRDEFTQAFDESFGVLATAAAKDNVVTYEWAFEWAEFQPFSTIKEGFKMQVNYQFHLTEDGSSVEYMNYATLDDAGSKVYPTVKLTAAPKAAPETTKAPETTAAPAATAPVTAAPAVTPSAPATFDAAVLAAAAAALSMTGCVIFRRKK